MANSVSVRQPKPVLFPPHLQGGVYCNLMLVTHTEEEFIMDFIMISETVSAVTARVIMSPGHIKRTIQALQNNLTKYEEKYKKTIKPAPEPAKPPLGYHTREKE